MTAERAGTRENAFRTVSRRAVQVQAVSGETMLLTCCRYLALLYAIGLAIGEAVINTAKDQWQYAPMWIIDYLIVAYLLIGFWVTRQSQQVPILMSAYALSTGVMYIVLFLGLDPDVPEAARLTGIFLALVGLVFAISVLGLVGTTIEWLRQDWARGSTSNQ